MRSPRRPTPPAAALALLACAALSGAAARAQGFRDLEPQDAFAAAAREGKPVMVALWSEGCRPCDAFDRTTFADEGVQAWLDRHVVAIRRVGDEVLAAQLELARSPALIFTSPNGVEIDRIVGFLEPEAFVLAATAVIEERTELCGLRRAVAERPEDPRARLDHAVALLLAGRPRAALEPLLWVLDRTRGDPAWEQERLGAVLTRIGVVQRTVPDATAALRERRDRAAATLLEAPSDEAGGPDPGTARVLCAREVVAFGRLLREQHRTLAIWDTLRAQEDPPEEVLVALFDIGVQGLLLADGRFDDFLAGLGDPLVLLEARLAALQARRAALEQTPRERSAFDIERGVAFAEAGRWYGALIGAGREDDAEALLQMLVGLEPCADAWLAPIQACRTMGQLDLGRALAERALAALPEGPERNRLRRGARNLLREDG